MERAHAMRPYEKKTNRLPEQCHPFTSPPIPKIQGLLLIYRSRAIASPYPIACPA
ncbi:MAG: hypothetical protein RLP02_26605 [Coleofasciculus sp. C2-GNP5-27]